MIGKIIVHAKTRDEAIAKMANALSECIVAGIHTNLSFQRKILLHPRFKSAEYDTKFLEEFLPS